MASEFEFLDTTHHDKLVKTLTSVADKWSDNRIQAQREGNQTQIVITTYMESLVYDLLVAFEKMIETDVESTTS